VSKAANTESSFTVSVQEIALSALIQEATTQEAVRTEARFELAGLALPMIKAVSKKYESYSSLAPEDLHQEGRLAAYEATLTWDPTRSGVVA